MSEAHQLTLLPYRSPFDKAVYPRNVGKTGRCFRALGAVKDFGAVKGLPSPPRPLMPTAGADYPEQFRSGFDVSVAVPSMEALLAAARPPAPYWLDRYFAQLTAPGDTPLGPRATQGPSPWLFPPTPTAELPVTVSPPTTARFPGISPPPTAPAPGANPSPHTLPAVAASPHVPIAIAPDISYGAGNQWLQKPPHLAAFTHATAAAAAVAAYEAVYPQSGFTAAMARQCKGDGVLFYPPKGVPR